MKKHTGAQSNNGIVNVIQKHLFATTAMTMAGVLATGAAYADPGLNELPTGFALQAGTVSTPTTVGNAMNMDQTSTRAVINWNTFNIGKNASVNFNQSEGKNAVVVNRVTNNTINKTEIFGQLTAQGTVMILDKNGVLFDTGATIDVGGLIAATGDLVGSDADFASGTGSFGLDNVGQVAGAKITNNANMTVKESGLLAFVAPYIENNGTINAKLGKVSLASASKVTVDLSGDNLISFEAGDALSDAYIKNSGTIDAQGGVVNISANVAKETIDEVINTSGVIKANSFEQKNGKIILSAKGGKVKVEGTLEANRGTTEGDANTAGDILVEGTEVEVTDTAEINATIVGVTTTTTTTTYTTVYTGYSYTKNGSTKSATTIEALLALYPGGGNFFTRLDILAKALVSDYSGALKRTSAEVPQTTTTTTHADGHGNGGTVNVFGDNKVNVAGKIDVSGGVTGNGGNAEISGNDLLQFSGVVDASAGAGGTRGTLTIDPPTVTIGSMGVTAAALAQTLGLSNVHIIAGNNIVVAEEGADLSNWNLVTTVGDLTLDAPTLDVLGDLTVGDGALDITSADTVNLGAKIQRKQPGFLGWLTPTTTQISDFDGGHASTVNVLDDDASIQQAIHIAQAGGNVNVAAGNYGGNLNVYKSLSLTGDGSLPLLFGTDLFGNVILVTANDVTVDGFTINGLYTGGSIPMPQSYGLVADGVTGLTVKNNTFSNLLGGGVKLSNVSGTVLDNNSFTLTGLVSDELQGILDLVSLFAEVPSGLTGAAIAVNGGDNVKISNNKVLLASTGIKLDTVSNSSLTGNIVLGVLQNAVEAAGFSYSDVTANILAGVGGNGLVVDGGEDLDINLNAIGGVISTDTLGLLSALGGGSIDLGSIELASSGDAVNISNVSGLGLTGNIIGVAGDDAIELTNVSDATVSLNAAGLSGDNALELNGVSDTDVFLNLLGGTTNGDGVKVNGGYDINVFLNAILLAGDDGVDVNGANDVNVAANLVFNANDNGVEVINSTDTNVLLNAITGSGANGVFVDPSTGVVALNYISGSGANGIHILDSDHFHVLANHVEGSGQNGILVQNSDGVLVALNQVSGSGNDGIHVEDSLANFIVGNNVSGSTGDGIDVERAAGTLVALNDVEGSGQNGIEVSESLGAIIAGNDVASSGKDGIRVTNAALTYVGHNDVTGSGEDGIGLYNSLGAWIDNNDVSTSGDDGIDVHFSAGTFVTDNDVEKSEDDGIDVNFSAGVLVDDNDVEKSGDNGIEVSNSALTFVTDNKVRKSGNDGIQATDSKGVQIRDNRVSFAGGDGIDVEDSSFADIEDNNVFKTGGNGIELTNSNFVDIEDNDINKAGENGIYAERSSFLEIDDNDVENSDEDGIYVDTAYNVSITDNDVEDSDGDGIDVDNVTKLLIDDNEVEDSGDTGIEVTDSKYVTISRNDVDESGHNGIDVSESEHVAIKRNDVDDSYNHGINVTDSYRVDIAFNDIEDSGRTEEYGEAYGDGIHVDGSRNVDIIGNEIDNSADDGIDVDGSRNEGEGYYGRFFREDNIVIAYNNVDESGDNGVEATNVSDLLVKKNRIDDSGTDGIYVSGSSDVRIRKNRVTDSGWNGISAYNNDDVRITDNKVRGGSGDGINVTDTGYVYIARNGVSNFYNGISVWYGYDVEIDNNRVWNVDNDGIQARNVGLFYLPSLFLEEGSEESEEIYHALRITNNKVKKYGDDGIQVSGSSTVLIANNKVVGDANREQSEEGNGEDYARYFNPETTGIRLGDNEGRKLEGKFQIAEVYFPYGGDFSGNMHVDVIGNNVKNNDVGLNATAFNNGYINLEGNTFRNNDVGAWFGSGLIDLTGETNTFEGGDIALRFERSSYTTYPQYEISLFDYSEEDYEEPSPETVFADLNLVDDTIGTTIFDGQTTYYIELLNGAFFNPGTPTIIEGRFATYDGFTPGETPMSPLQLKAIEDMINDYDDDNSLGQIFVGVAFDPFDDNDIMRKIFGGNFKGGKAGFVITGLPNTGTGGGGQGGFSPQSLNNLAPAAGGDDGELTVEDLANLAPAAGGESNGVVDGACWGNAGAAGGGNAVNFDLSDDPSEILSDQSNCGSGEEL